MGFWHLQWRPHICFSSKSRWWSISKQCYEQSKKWILLVHYIRTQLFSHLIPSLYPFISLPLTGPSTVFYQVNAPGDVSLPSEIPSSQPHTKHAVGAVLVAQRKFCFSDVGCSYLVQSWLWREVCIILERAYSYCRFFYLCGSGFLGKLRATI